jgi:L-alanine-DL-glutamate epimerase-like enolase superfamily enzyme
MQRPTPQPQARLGGDGHATAAAERVPVESLAVSVYRIPTEKPESDGTLEWNGTTMVLVELRAGGEHGIGFSYTSSAAATLIEERLKDLVVEWDALDVPGAWQRMVDSVRNIGRPGVASSAIAAVDVALWDLKALLLGVPLVVLLGAVRESVPVYGSGGFTSQTVEETREQLAGWVVQGIASVKMKVGGEPRTDAERVRAAREAIGDGAELMVDANGAYDRKQALAQAQAFAEHGVTWFEEPVSSDDLEGLRVLRDRMPPGMEVAAGEYGYDLPYFQRMLEAGAVDALQADATRCAGITGYLRVDPLCSARSMPLSAHTAPTIHAHPSCAMPSVRHVEWFHDHVLIEQRFFDGALTPVEGALRPDRSRPGLGAEFKRADAERYRVA